MTVHLWPGLPNIQKFTEQRSRNRGFASISWSICVNFIWWICCILCCSRSQLLTINQSAPLLLFWKASLWTIPDTELRRSFAVCCSTQPNATSLNNRPTSLVFHIRTYLGIKIDFPSTISSFSASFQVFSSGGFSLGVGSLGAISTQDDDQD